MKRKALGAFVALAFAAAGCASGGRGASPVATGETTTTSTAGATTSTTAPPPSRIVLIGDSIMDEVNPAVEAATAGQAEVNYVLTIGTANVKDDWWQIWAPLIQSDRPDAVAVLVGPWEINRPDLGTPAWAAWYGARLDAWANLLTAGGAHLYWVLPVPVRDPVANAEMSIVSDAYTQLAARRHDTTLVNSGDALGSRQYLEHAPSGERLRRTDGLHLCPAGAILIAEALLRQMGIQPVPGWLGGSWEISTPAQSPSWATDEPSYSPTECPA